MLAASAATAQFTTTAHDARSGAMGGSLLFAPGTRSLDLGYRQGFLLPGMADKQVRLQMPVASRGSLTASYLHHGNADYLEQQLQACYAMRVAERLAVGVDARYLHLGTADAHYPSHRWLAAAAVAQAYLGRTTLTLLGGTRPWDTARPFRWHANVLYAAVPQVYTVVAEVESEDAVRLRMGMEYAYEHRLFVRAGLATRPMVLTFGLGARMNRYSIDLAAEVHSSLGITPHLTMTLWL